MLFIKSKVLSRNQVRTGSRESCSTLFQHLFQPGKSKLFLTALKIRATLADPAAGSCKQVMERVCKMCRWQQLGSVLQKSQEMKFQRREKDIWHYCQERNLCRSQEDYFIASGCDEMVERPCQEAKGNRSQKAEVENENWLGSTAQLVSLSNRGFLPMLWVGISISSSIRKPREALWCI